MVSVQRKPSDVSGVGTLYSFRMFHTVIGMLEGISSNYVWKLRNTMSHSLQHEVILPEGVWRI